MGTEVQAKNSPTPAPAITPVPANLLQRKCACGGDSGVAGECEDCRKKRIYATRELTNEYSSPNSIPAIVRSVLQTPGQMLDANLRTYFETRFQKTNPDMIANSSPNTMALSELKVGSPNDPLEVEAENRATQILMESGFEEKIRNRNGNINFSSVRIHTDTQAAESARTLGARAYTVGNHVVFGPGQYQPQNITGRHLLAHELTHVTQNNTNFQARRMVWRKKFGTNEVDCTANLSYKVQLLFKNKGGNTWDPARKNSFRTKFKASIEDTFNANTYKIKPTTSSYKAPWYSSNVMNNCPCATTGFKPVLGIDLVKDGEISTSEDWEADVFANPSGDFMQSNTNTSYGTLDEADIKSETKEGSAPGVTQIPAVHEFGHSIGLDHPGVGLEGGLLSKSKLSPGANEYTHVGKDKKGRDVNGPIDLMGSGMGLRPFYFDVWRDQLNDQYGSDCGWKTQ